MVQRWIYGVCKFLNIFYNSIIIIKPKYKYPAIRTFCTMEETLFIEEYLFVIHIIMYLFSYRGVIIFAMSSGCLPFRLDEKEQSLSYDQQRRLLVSRIQKGILQKHKNLISHYSKGKGALRDAIKYSYRIMKQPLSF